MGQIRLDRGLYKWLAWVHVGVTGIGVVDEVLMVSSSRCKVGAVVNVCDAIYHAFVSHVERDTSLLYSAGFRRLYS